MDDDFKNGDFTKPMDTVNKTLCRCCLSTNKKMKDAFVYSDLFRDLTGIQVSPSDGLPQWLCVECSYLLLKSVKFKRKVLKAHSILYEYSSRCAPFPIDVHDEELHKYATPHLAPTKIMTFDNHGKQRQGFHKIEEHEKPEVKSELLDVPLEYNLPVEYGNASDLVKNEDLSDLDDDMPLHEYRSQIDKFDEEDLASLLEDGNVVELKTEEKVMRRHKRMKRKDDKSRKRKRENMDSETIAPKSTIRQQPMDLDPMKIVMIKLSMAEQIKQREIDSKSEGYLKFPFRCQLCFKGFNFENKLDNHMKKHDPARGKFECSLCHMHLPSIYSFRIHEATHSTRYECVACGRRMTDRGSIVEHYRATHEGLVTHYSCHLCGKVSSNSKTHRGHLRNHHSGDRPRCDQCGKTFVNRDSLNEHILIHQGVKNHECEQCGKRFRTKTQVKHHQLKHTSSRDFYCVECDVRFKSAHNLRQHLAKSLKHRDKHSLKYPCARCDRRFESERSLQHHVTFQHEGVRLHGCATCGAALATRGSLAKHVRAAHRGYRPPLKHVCDTCGKAFRSKSVLVNHVRTHTGEKPFECGECGRRFSQRTAMRTHVKLVHLKIKRGTKLKEMQELTNVKPQIKEDVPLIFETWSRQSLPAAAEIFFTAAT